MIEFELVFGSKVLVNPAWIIIAIAQNPDTTTSLFFPGTEDNFVQVKGSYLEVTRKIKNARNNPSISFRGCRHARKNNPGRKVP